ncbi:hypothetical protein FKM82_013619 [Ascaphus truei]
MLILNKSISYLYFFLQMYLTLGCQEMKFSTEFSNPGDYIIAGLFTLHEGEVSAKSRPEIDICQSTIFNSHGYHLFQAMRFSIEEINNSSTLLPNVTLGYEIYDSCSDSTNLYGTLRVLSQCTEPYIKMQNNFTEYKTKAIALIGPPNSNFAFTTASILGMFLVPQISYSATNELLSIKQIYPSFLRSIPSDKFQVEVMLHLLQKFNWTWIAIVGSDNVYGRHGLQSLYALVVKNGICVAYQGIIPYNMDRTEIREMLGYIIQTRVKVIVVFSTNFLARIFFEEVVQGNITEIVWIGSESWSVDSRISSIPNINRIGSVLGVSVGEMNIPRLSDFEACVAAQLKSRQGPDKLSVVLLVIITLLLIITIAIAVVFTLNLNTPVVKSAGGKMCLVMLMSLACSCCTLYCYFGKPHKVTCMIRQPLFAVSFTVCLSCIVVHSFQIVCIFKMATHMPKMYNIWVKKNGHNNFIIVSSAAQILISTIWIAVKPPEAIENYSIFEDQIIFECSETNSIGSITEIVYIGMLSMFCFIFCYMGKDLPENYNEAKCISFSLLVYFFSWIAFFTTYIIYKGKYIAAVNVTSVLASIFGILSGYFTPKCYIILFRQELNTTEHFQTAIQNYTKKQSVQ